MRWKFVLTTIEMMIGTALVAMSTAMRTNTVDTMAATAAKMTHALAMQYGDCDAGKRMAFTMAATMSMTTVVEPLLHLQILCRRCFRK